MERFPQALLIQLICIELKSKIVLEKKHYFMKKTNASEFHNMTDASISGFTHFIHLIF